MDVLIYKYIKVFRDIYAYNHMYMHACMQLHRYGHAGSLYIYFKEQTKHIERDISL